MDEFDLALLNILRDVEKEGLNSRFRRAMEETGTNPNEDLEITIDGVKIKTKFNDLFEN